MKQTYTIEVQNRFNELISNNDVDDEMDPEGTWTKLETALVECADKIIPKKPAMTKNKWMTTEIVDLMSTRKMVKNKKVVNTKYLTKKLKKNVLKRKRNGSMINAKR